MTSLNRSLSPRIQNLKKPDILKAKSICFSNGLNVYSINGETEGIVRIEWLFHAGTSLNNKPLVANATNFLLKEGSLSFSSYEINKKLDFYGASLSMGINTKFASLTLYCLNKYLDQVLPIIKDFISNPIFIR